MIRLRRWASLASQVANAGVRSLDRIASQWMQRLSQLPGSSHVLSATLSLVAMLKQLQGLIQRM